MNKNINLKPYTVHYRDFQNVRLENCFYAFDAYEARTLAMEFNKYIKWFDDEFFKFLFSKYVYCLFDIADQERYKLKKSKINEI